MKEEKLKVNETRWKEAQIYEREVWIKRNQNNSLLRLVRKFVSYLIKKPDLFLISIRYSDFYCGDDSNLWWLKQFDKYKVLPKYIERALEVGCGPFTNMRLISKCSKINEIVCSDPSIELYKTFKLTWLVRQIKKNKIKVSDDKCENLKYPDKYFDLVVCINVLDHVQDAIQCLKEIDRVIKIGGFIILGQDLSNKEDIEKIMKTKDEIGHPIKINHILLDDFFKQTYKNCFKRVLPRDKGRDPKSHYGTYIFIGQKN
jgi:ubiquinone/menaquinone biosynthesis C-methylase UbiE